MSLASGETKLDVDFPYFFTGKNNLGDYVWRDISGNGNWTDEGAQFSNGINGVTVTLYLDDGDGIFDPGSGGDLLLVTTVTTNTGASGTGFYNFLIPAVTTPQTYWVDPSGAALAGLVLTSESVFGEDPMLVTNTGTSIDTVDFGYAQPVTVTGAVYNDPLGDKSGNTGLAGVVITATLSGGTPVTTTTDASGLYTFTNLIPGSYTIVEGTPVGYESTGDVDGANDDTIHLTLTSGNDVTGQNFWDRPGGSIGDFVWYDTNGNGVQDGGEPGIPGVVISLTNSVGAVVTTTTNASGLYSFTELLPGVYTVTVVSGTPSGSVGTVGVDSKTSPYQLTLAANQDITNADFGYDSPSSYIISKTRMGLDTVRTNQEVTYTIRVTNTGQSWLTTVPLSDSFDSQLLYFLRASVRPVSTLNVSPLTWTDVTTALGDVAPNNGTISLTVTFIGMRDTTLLPGGVAVNTITAVNPLADPDGPGGPLGNLEVLPSKAATATVEILGPTSVSLINTSARPLVQGGTTLVQVNWETVNELNVGGFDLHRLGPGDAVVKLTEQPMLASKAGQAEGKAYSFVDATAVENVSYAYVLEILLTNGQSEVHRLGTVQWHRQIFLPLIVR